MLAGVWWLRGPGNVLSSSFSAPGGDVGVENRYIFLCSAAVLNLQSKSIDDYSHLEKIASQKHLNHSEHLDADSLTQTPGETFHLEPT